ncbi:uncharacterized protein TM35_000034980 [Trypanosoma theileri]|uniref:Uncharacterized protein n=1 Tax=Trypanosoma theileri TaxID=67003 RepID=A0A1X0P7C3_9TRYP|nr:uncharacterized protein TM35_000034980 [Trypanosoma theileri]ORC92745.1 hypothetical protein TM35_000034980 [Trypanosoma theileri]
MLCQARGACSGIRGKRLPMSSRFWFPWARVLRLSLCPTLYVNEFSKSLIQISSYRWMHTNADEKVSNIVANEDDEEASLEDYEELLLNSASSGTIEEESQSENLHENKINDEQQSTGRSSTMKLVNEILELLPADGVGLRLTTITPALDLESVSELYGSVLGFVQLFPHRFRCYQIEESDGSLRWYISRAQVVTTDSLSSQYEERNHFHRDDEHDRGILLREKKVKLHNVIPEFSCVTTRRVLEELQKVLPNDEPIATTGLLNTLPKELQDIIRNLGGGLLRLLKSNVAQDYVDLSLDTSMVSVKGLLSSRKLPTYHQQSSFITDSVSLPLQADEDYAKDVWDVELDLDEDTKNEVIASYEENDINGAAEPDEGFFHDGSCATATVPAGSPQVFRQIPPALPKPPEGLQKRKTPPPLQQKKKEVEKVSGRMSPDELLKAHTVVAQLRGRRSPSEMLDLFVECIPTFYVPVQKIKLTDALARILGPQNTLHKVIRIYSYYFDRDKTVDTVRLKPSIQHLRIGIANVLYQNMKDISVSSDGIHRKLQVTDVTRAFPVLQAPLRTGVQASAVVKKESTFKVAQGNALTVDSPSPEWFALLETIPHDRYISISEWAHEANLPIERVQSFTEDVSHNHYFLTRSGKEGEKEEEEEEVLWRLRPYWLSPGATGELGVEYSTIASTIARYLKPIWFPLDRLLQKLTLSERDNIMKAAQPYGGVEFWLRKFGRFCWVDESGKKVRKYCSVSDLDDITHPAITYLQYSLSTEYVKLEDIIHGYSISSWKINNAPKSSKTGIRHLLNHGLEVSRRCLPTSLEKNSRKQECTQDMQESVNYFLSRHRQSLNIKEEGDSVWVARRSFFRSGPK